LRGEDDDERAKAWKKHRKRLEQRDFVRASVDEADIGLLGQN
jgi:hypothetical protein